MPTMIVRTTMILTMYKNVNIIDGYVKQINLIFSRFPMQEYCNDKFCLFVCAPLALEGYCYNITSLP